MVYRGIVHDNTPIRWNLFFGWLYGTLIRYNFPYLILFLLTSCTINFWGNFVPLKILVFINLIPYLLYLSVCIHETFHFVVARFLKIEIQGISMLPFTFSVKILLKKETVKCRDDFSAVLFAGPFLSILLHICMFIFVAAVNLRLAFLLLLILNIINILSLIPVMKGSDAYKIHRNRTKIKQLFLYMFAYLACTFNIIDTNE